MLMYAPTINPTTFEKQHIWITCDIRKRMNGMVIATACRLCVSARHHQYIPNVCSCGFDIFTSQKCHQNFRFAGEYPIGFCHGIGTSVYQHWVFWFGKSKETFEYDLQIKWKTCAASFLTLPLQLKDTTFHVRGFTWLPHYICYRCQEIQAISSFFLHAFQKRKIYDDFPAKMLSNFSTCSQIRHYDCAKHRACAHSHKHLKLFSIREISISESPITFSHILYTDPAIHSDIRIQNQN